MLNREGDVKIGAPTLTAANVVVDVVSHKRGPKKIAFKMRRRKGYHRTVGHRQSLTVVQVKEING